jgi:ppGpp synthetase/RelA/SpoT-type nucleotidyltranferase
MSLSKSKVDKAGQALAKGVARSEEELVELEGVFDDYRKSHLKPLTDLTIELQRWLTEYGTKYYIAQRLKRKPQIVRKLNRLHVRLSQLQDIGGCRIIVADNRDVDRLQKFLAQKLSATTSLKTTDYRAKGRDDTGYRALHLLFTRDGLSLELQVRSQVQHYWAESIERTSVVYGHHLKEKEGDPRVIDYFKALSDIFYEIESGRQPAPKSKIEIDRLRVATEQIIVASDTNKVFDSFVNEDVIKTLTEIESKRVGFNNWIMVFNWNTGSFTTWDIIDRDPDAAAAKYGEYERQFPAHQGFEVVMIGSSDVATVRQTHSHYFGIASYDHVLEKLDQSVVGFSKRMDIDSDARQILLALSNRDFWGKKKACSIPTLKNHYCQSVFAFDAALRLLAEKELVLLSSASGPVSLNVKKTNEIRLYL